MKIAVVFPGYGSQSVGMGKNIYDDERLVQEYFEQASACVNINFVKLCFASSQDELDKMHNCYQALFVLGYSLYALLQAEEIKPDMICGDSIGEYTALACAGALTFPDGLYFLSKYAQFYQEFSDTNPVAIIAVEGISTEKLKKILHHMPDYSDLAIAISRQHELFVSGRQTSIDALKQQLDDQYDCTYEDKSLAYGLHSPIAQPIVDALKPYMTKIDVKNLSVPCMRLMDGKIIETADEVSATMLSRITGPIFSELIIHAVSAYDLIIQIGPSDALANKIQKEFPGKGVLSFNERSDLNEIKKFIELYPRV